MSLNDFQRTNAVGPETLFALPQAASQTYAPTETPAKEVIVESLPLTRLPVAMRKMGWGTAAALMQRWFDSPAWEMPEDWKDDQTQPAPLSLAAAQCDQSIVKMDWAIKFERCRKAVEIAESRLTTINAISRFKYLLKNAGWDGEHTVRLGSCDMSARQIDASAQINIAPLGDILDVLDDMYGALGQATIKVGVVGYSFSEKDQTTQQTQHRFRVEHLGFYIRDHYDFNGPQYLGTWTDERVLTKAETAFTTTLHGQLILRLQNGPFAVITNSDFRAYRKKTNQGGDFVIYSDVLWKKVDQVIDLGMSI